MPIPEKVASSSFDKYAVLKSAFAAGASGMGTKRGVLSEQIEETNRRIDGVIRHQNLSPEMKAKVEDLRRAFNERMESISGSATDRAKMMEDYRAARRALSEGLTDLLGGPRAG